ncbi:MAG: flagellar biosynthetic protein FliO [Candidatus Kryptoniota bacterium]
MDWLIFKTFLTLALIFGLMFVILFIMRKYFNTKPRFVNENLKVLTSLNIQAKKAVYIIKAFNKVIVVGVSDNAIASLGEITDTDVIQKLETTGGIQQRRSFADILKGLSPR